MSEFRYPTVDLGFMVQLIKATGRLDKGGLYRTDNHLVVTIAGPQIVSKRTIRIRILESDQVGFEQSIGIAHRFKFLIALLDWLEKNRNWKDGAYFEPKNQQS